MLLNAFIHLPIANWLWFCRYNVHEKIVNFMAPQPMSLPAMASKLFENLFGLKTQKPAGA